MTAGRLDHQQVGLACRLEFEPIGRAPGDDDVIEVAKRQRAEHRVQAAAAGMNEDHLVGVGVAEQLFLRLLGAAAASVTSSLPKSTTRPEIGSPARGIVRVFT